MPVNKILILNFKDNACNGIYSKNGNVPLRNINNNNFNDECTIFYTKDDTHHIFRCKGIWKIANHNINDYYLFSQCKKQKLWEHETFDFFIFDLKNASTLSVPSNQEPVHVPSNQEPVPVPSNQEPVPVTNQELVPVPNQEPVPNQIHEPVPNQVPVPKPVVKKQSNLSKNALLKLKH